LVSSTTVAMEVIKGRMYDYNNGRFLSVDPFIQSPTSTQSMNPYTYIFNNPLSGVDPTGYKSELDDKSFTKTTKFAPTGSNIRSGTKTSGVSTGGVSFSVSVNGSGQVLSSSGVDKLGTSGASTQIGKDGSISGTGGQSARMQEPVVLGENPETGENLDRRTAKLFTPFAGPLMELTERCMGSNGCNSGDVTKQVALTGLEFGIAKGVDLLGKYAPSAWKAIALWFKGSKSLDNAVFAQVRSKGTKAFSEKGQIIYSRLAGKSITTVDDLTNALTSGLIKSSQVPLDYVVMGGQKVIANTRTSTALINANIPKSQWIGINKTGIKAYDDVTFDTLVQRQLNKNYGGSVNNARRE